MSKQPLPTSKAQGITPIPVSDRIPKRWQAAERKYGHMQNQLDNRTVEGAFHELLYKVKQLLKQHPQTYFERDFKYDNTENAFTMHAFICKSVYLHLECTYHYVYQVQYAFNNCFYEAEIRKLLFAYIFTQRGTEVKLSPDFNTFYSGVLRVQDKKHLHSL